MTTRLILSAALSALGGYVALSYEILWYRVYSFANAGHASSFGLMLGVYLCGVAAGSYASSRYCEADRDRALKALSLFTLLGNLLAFSIVPLYARWVGWMGEAAKVPIVAAPAVFLGAVFPLVAHFAISPDERAGEGVSYVYVANIIGSVLGSVVTGFWLFDVWSTRAVTLQLLLLGMALTIATTLLARTPRRWARWIYGGATLAAAAGILASPVLFDRLFERLQLKTWDPPRFVDIVENKSGIITVDSQHRVYGGGVYDGGYNVSLDDDLNGIIRSYASGAMHPDPKRVLVIGLASGSAAQVLVHHPSVEKLVAVEINPGYVELLSKYSAVASLVSNPKVEIVIDDARRWLARTDDTFDLVLSNNSFHWRGQATHLLSQEFFRLVQSRLRPGGILVFNPTGSMSALKTAASVFRHLAMVGNFGAVSDTELALSPAQWELLLTRYHLDGRPIFDFSRSEDVQLRNAVLAKRPTWPPDLRAHLLASEEGVIVTDDNMATEWQ